MLPQSVAAAAALLEVLMSSPISPTVVRHANGALDFTDASGAIWTVSEITRMDFSERVMALLPHPERRQGWLLFESQLGERRRFTPIPDDWHEYSSPMLQRCLIDAVPASAGERRRRDDQER
jgi:hypothetical protein